MEENKNVEIFEEESIIELFDDENTPVQFFEIASVELDGKFYELLQPVEPLEGIEDDECVIFEYEQGEKPEEKTFKPLLDEELANRIFSEYLKAASELECDCCGCGDEDCDCHGHHGEGCGCGDDDCGCGCHHDDDED